MRIFFKNRDGSCLHHGQEFLTFYPLTKFCWNISHRSWDMCPFSQKRRSRQFWKCKLSKKQIVQSCTD